MTEEPLERKSIACFQSSASLLQGPLLVDGGYTLSVPYIVQKWTYGTWKTSNGNSAHGHEGDVVED